MEQMESSGGEGFGESKDEAWMANRADDEKEMEG